MDLDLVRAAYGWERADDGQQSMLHLSLASEPSSLHRNTRALLKADGMLRSSAVD